MQVSKSTPSSHTPDFLGFFSQEIFSSSMARFKCNSNLLVAQSLRSSIVLGLSSSFSGRRYCAGQPFLCSLSGTPASLNGIESSIFVGAFDMINAGFSFKTMLKALSTALPLCRAGMSGIFKPIFFSNHHILLQLL